MSATVGAGILRWVGERKVGQEDFCSMLGMSSDSKGRDLSGFLVTELGMRLRG